MTATRIDFGLTVLLMGILYLFVKLDLLDANNLRFVVPLAVVSLGLAILLAWRSRGPPGGK